MHSGQFNLSDEFNTSEDLKVHKSPSHVGYCILIIFTRYFTNTSPHPVCNQ